MSPFSRVIRSYGTPGLYLLLPILLLNWLPYRLFWAKEFNGNTFRRKPAEEYRRWFQGLIDLLMSMMKPDATLYVCSDWSTSTLIFPVLDAAFQVRNRVTWERDKGRGAKMNWKNNTEDIWFCTRSDRYHFNVDAVKLKRRVLAPCRASGTPKDWSEEPDGKFRLTHPSNIWTDITVPFWSMPENTDHPAQKPEKLMAKLILASSRPGDWVFDPFLGSGTTAVVAACGRVDILVSNSGTGQPHKIVDTTYEEWDRVMNVNARATFALARKLLPGMMQRKFGRFVTISSNIAVYGTGGGSFATYAASKAALIAMTKGIAHEGAPYVTANAILPCMIRKYRDVST